MHYKGTEILQHMSMQRIVSNNYKMQPYKEAGSHVPCFFLLLSVLYFVT